MADRAPQRVCRRLRCKDEERVALSVSILRSLLACCERRIGQRLVQFVFEGAADADLSAIMAIELLIGDHRIEAPVERLSNRQVKAVCFAPMEMVIDRARRVVNSPIRLRALTA